jgi:tRNA-2-methylthio-N6-dimethylallyladenosine synthase
VNAPRYHIETFGCQMNVHDSQRMEDALVAAGWLAADGLEHADLIVFNTCSVREKAEQKLRSEVGRLRPLKERRHDLVVAVAGCVAQQEGERLLTEVPHLDVVVGPDNLAELPALAETVRLGGPPLARTVFDLEAPTFLTTRNLVAGGRSRPISAFVTTMKGCDERCSFCIVPYTRGPERYRPLEDIVDEIRGLVDAGAREVTLLGQTVNSWSPPEHYAPRDDGRPARDRGDDSAFCELLAAIAERVPGLGRLRYTSPHPRHVTPRLVEAHRDLSVLAEHVHLPVQSGSDRMLKRMIRRYTRADYLERAEQLKSARAGLTLSTDVIVGFPGETDEDFDETLSLVREAGFVAAFGFKFSPRPNTPALKLADDVPESVKAERLAALFATVETAQRRHLASLVGSRVRVLVEGESRPASAKGKKPGTFQKVMGRSQRNEIVHIDVPEGRDGAAMLGRFFELQVVAANAHSLVGALSDADALGLPAGRGPTVPSVGDDAAGAHGADGRSQSDRAARSLRVIG